MGARKKLNTAYVTGSLVLSAVLGLAAQSWAVFFVLLVLMLAANFYESNLR